MLVFLGGVARAGGRVQGSEFRGQENSRRRKAAEGSGFRVQRSGEGQQPTAENINARDARDAKGRKGDERL